VAVVAAPKHSANGHGFDIDELVLVKKLTSKQASLGL
jgi:hypothetical protein